METKQKSQMLYILVAVSLCAVAMSLVDGVIQPGYWIKSFCKLILFLCAPLCYFAVFPDERSGLKLLFTPTGKSIAIAFGLGVMVYGVILGGYVLLSSFVDLTDAILSLTSSSGVSADNFLWVALYISFVNSLLEELLFRGFSFITLRRHISRIGAYFFSALTFAFYHAGMIAVSMNFGIWLGAMVGLTIAGCVLNFLNEKSENIYVSWLVHMFANFAINTVGFIVL